MSEELSAARAKQELRETLDKIQTEFKPVSEEIRANFIRRKAVEFVADKAKIRATMREQREKRGVKVSQSKLP